MIKNETELQLKKCKDEDDLKSGMTVYYRRGMYTTGNIRHDLVELYRDNELCYIVKIKSVYVEEKNE